MSIALGFHNTVVNGLPIGWFSTIGAGEYDGYSFGNQKKQYWEPHWFGYSHQ